MQAELAEKNIAADSREARGLVAGFGRMGAGLGGFKRYEDIEAETPVDSRRSAGRGMKAPTLASRRCATRTRPWRGRSGARSTSDRGP